MRFPVKPQCLNLTPLEERLISPRIPFMQICELPRGGQLSIHGNVVNVPADVNSTVSTLPRSIDESQTIPIKLKRRLSYKHHYQSQNVRPRKVLEAAKYLVKTSELFQNEHIEVRKIGLIILILEVMIFLQIKVMNGKNSSVIHTQALIMRKYIQIYLKLLFLNLLKDMIIMPNNYSLTVMVMMDGVKWRRELQVSQIPYYKNQI